MSLLGELASSGLREHMPIFIQNFLTDRTFAAKVSGIISDIFVHDNGLPQGSVLSLTLFLIMINDFISSAPSSIQLKYSLFANDCAIWTSSRVQRLAVERVLKRFDRVQKWALKWGFKFALHKYQCVLFLNVELLKASN